MKIKIKLIRKSFYLKNEKFFFLFKKIKTKKTNKYIAPIILEPKNLEK